MARYTRTVCFSLSALITVTLLILTGCSDNFNSPLSLDNSALDPGTPGGKGPASGNNLYGENANARDSRILQTRQGESLSPADITLRFDSDAIPADIKPRVELIYPNLFEFNIEPLGTTLNQPIDVIIDYSKADLEGVNEAELQVYEISGGGLVPVITQVNISENRAYFQAEEFARYALARD
jgi:hypothetical protein